MIHLYRLEKDFPGPGAADNCSNLCFQQLQGKRKFFVSYVDLQKQLH